jgi:hypothetical protein
MSSTYSTNLRTELIGSGDQAGTWGTTTNTTLGTILEQAIAGVSGGPYISGTYPAVNFPTDADITLTANNGAVDQSRSAVLVVTSTGSLSATRNVIAPSSASKIYIIKNSTTGGQSIQIKYSTGTGVTIANGLSAIVYGDGTNFNLVTNPNSVTGNLAVSGNETVGGTLAVTGAQTNSSTFQATTITATTQFSGPGTGLTGTAASLNIGGNAATATNGLTTGNYNSYAPTLTGTGASGTWGINITGNAATATNGLTTGNYNSYAPTLTGTGASGTWGISISGNAATATNAVNATNPSSGGSFITSSNIGSQSVNYATSAGSAGSATTATTATNATRINNGSYNMQLSYAGQSGQPTWLWGTNDGATAYVWNPSNFSVNYATSAGFATTATTATYATYAPSGATLITSSSIGSQSVNYASSAGSAVSASTATNATNATTAASCSGNSATATSPASGGSFITSSNIGSQSVAFASNSTNSTAIANSGGWSVFQSGARLYFNYNGSNVGSIDSSGNIRVTGSVIANTTP